MTLILRKSFFYWKKYNTGNRFAAQGQLLQKRNILINSNKKTLNLQ